MDLLDGVVRDYAWGATDVIAELQGRRPSGSPEAELWLGAHPSAPATLRRAGIPLDDAIEADPAGLLGPDVGRRFDSFPFLLKVLAAADVLSIQAHPSLEQARAGFDREEEAGIPTDDRKRIYRDRNHKPELICALTPFEAKCGFRALPATRALLTRLAAADSTGALDGLLSHLGSDGGPDAGADGAGTGSERADGDVIRDAMGWLVALPEAERQRLVEAAAAAAGRELERAGAEERELWWTAELQRRYPGDIGVVVALFLNHLILQPGQAVFLSAGNLHAYLEGAGVELMANSDNVVRGGLTPKHVDAEELVAVLDTSTGPPPVQTAAGPAHAFDIPVPEFGLTRLLADGQGQLDQRFEPTGPEIVLVTDGSLELRSEGRAGGPAASLAVGRGQAAFVAWSDGPYRVVATGPAVAWRATVGVLGATA